VRDAEPLELREIRQRNEAAARGNLRRWEQTRCPYVRWWLERHPFETLRELAAFVPDEPGVPVRTPWSRRATA